MNDFYALEDVHAAGKSISVIDNEITFSKCDGSNDFDKDCKSDVYYKHFNVAVFVVLNDFKSTSNVNKPV